MEGTNDGEAGLQTKPTPAPVELLAELVGCLMMDEHETALALCKKVLQAEPGNQDALELLTVLKERLELDEQLSTDSSSDEDDQEEDSSSEEESYDSSSSSGPRSPLPAHCKHY